MYSGTFSGALNPALQDPKGRPRRDVATIVHILNDLLCSVPELRRVNRKGSEEPLAPAPEQQDEPTTSTSCSEDQNLRTRGKLEHLRLVMGERRERRRQRKQKPYSLPQSDTDTVTAWNSASLYIGFQYWSCPVDILFEYDFEWLGFITSNSFNCFGSVLKFAVR